MTDEKLPVTDHLEELRRRIIYCLIAVGAGFVICYAFSKQLFYLLSYPLASQLPEGSTFIFTNITEAFFTYLKLAFFAGIFLASPVIIYQIWRFVAPGLYQHEAKYAIPFVVLSTIFFVGGSLFAYYAVFPIAFTFFIGYSTDSIRMLPSLREYLSFSFKFLIAFGIVFELPIFILFLAKMGVVTEKQLRSNRKYVILLIFIVAAILTPPDVISQVLMAVPLMILYEISIYIAKIFGRKTKATASSD